MQTFNRHKLTSTGIQRRRHHFGRFFGWPLVPSAVILLVGSGYDFLRLRTVHVQVMLCFLNTTPRKKNYPKVEGGAGGLVESHFLGEVQL